MADAPARAEAHVAARLRSFLPRGGTLPDDIWSSRHRGVLILLWLHLPALFLFALARDKGWKHGLLEAGIVALPAMAALCSTGRRRESTVFASVGLMTASAVLVHLSGGVIEAHFHFFVMVGVVVLYQDWVPFLIAIAFVVLHHGIMGVVSPHDVYNHKGAWEQPWTWAGIHGASILAMSAAGIANWKMNERSQSQLARLAAIVESSDDAIYGWTVDGRINSWNQGAVRLYGYSRDEIVGRRFTVLIPPHRAAEATSQLEQIRRGERVDPFDSERLSKDGSVVEVSVHISAVRNRDGEVVGGATIARDITERRRAEEALRASERELQDTLSLLGATLESTADGILVVEPDGRISSFNGRFAEMWRLPEPVLASRDDNGALAFVLDQLLDPDAFIAKVKELYVQPEAESHDTLHFKDGRVFERSSKPQRVGGAVVGRVWSFSDVTDRKRLEADLAEARDKALESSRLKSEFLATMSHEIRTPMNGVIGLTGLLLDTALTDTQRQYADGVRLSGEALLGIINDILDFSKIEAGKLELEMVDFHLGQALDEVAALVAEPARAKGLDLVVFCAPDVPTVLRGDVGRLRQVLLNLVSNAIKFTPAGEVVLRAGVGDGAGAEQVVVHVEVSDTGIGIAPPTAERLFEPFSQADASTTRRYGGTGLGLAICRRLVKAMGGRIGLDSALGQGSTFWVDLPLGRAARPVSSPARPAARPARSVEKPGAKGRLLIVEDNAVNQAVAKGLVARLGYGCDVAADGREALDALSRQHYDAILMDCQMPEMDGFEATAEIRRREAGTDPVPIIAMTAGVLVADRERCLAAGMDDYVTKPVKGPALDRVLSRWFPAGDAGDADSAPARQRVTGTEPIDPERLEELRALDPDGSAGLLPRLFGAFLAQAASDLASLSSAFQVGDDVSVQRVAQGLKGAARDLGATDIAPLCADLEAAASSGRLLDAADLLPRIETALDRLQHAASASG